MAISATAPAPFKKRQRSPVKPKSMPPPGRSLGPNQDPAMRDDVTMGGQTPFMQPPARNTSFMANGGRGQGQGGVPAGSPRWPQPGPRGVSGQMQGARPMGSPPRQMIGPGGVQGQPQGMLPPGSPPRQMVTHMADGGRGDLADRRMFANGRRPHNPPMMMANGFGDVQSPVDDAPQPGMTPAGGDNDQDDQQPQVGGGMQPVPTPESLGYHDELRTCETCEYMGADGNCQMLQMQVSPQGACEAFSPKAGGDQGAQPGEDNGDEYAGTTPSIGG